MDESTYSSRDVDPRGIPRTLFDQSCIAIEALRVRTQQFEAWRLAGVLDFDIRRPTLDADIPLPFATPPGAAPTF